MNMKGKVDWSIIFGTLIIMAAIIASVLVGIEVLSMMKKVKEAKLQEQIKTEQVGERKEAVKSNEVALWFTNLKGEKYTVTMNFESPEGVRHELRVYESGETERVEGKTN